VRELIATLRLDTAFAQRLAPAARTAFLELLTDRLDA
jgi:hypothetical protein